MYQCFKISQLPLYCLQIDSFSLYFDLHILLYKMRFASTIRNYQDSLCYSYGSIVLIKYSMKMLSLFSDQSEITNFCLYEISSFLKSALSWTSEFLVLFTHF